MKVIDTVGKSWKIYKNNLKDVLKIYGIILFFYIFLVLVIIGIIVTGIRGGNSGESMASILFGSSIILNLVFLLLICAFLSSLYKIMKKKKYSFIKELKENKMQAVKLWIILICLGIIFIGIMLLTTHDAYFRLIEISFSTPMLTTTEQEIMQYSNEMNSIVGELFLGIIIVGILELVLVILLFYLPLEMIINNSGFKQDIKNSIKKIKKNIFGVFCFMVLWGLLIYIPILIPCIGFLISIFITIPMACIAYILYWDNKK